MRIKCSSPHPRTPSEKTERTGGLTEWKVNSNNGRGTHRMDEKLTELMGRTHRRDGGLREWMLDSENRECTHRKDGRHIAQMADSQNGWWTQNR